MGLQKAKGADRPGMAQTMRLPLMRAPLPHHPRLVATPRRKIGAMDRHHCI
jgi:hypothetical protein